MAATSIIGLTGFARHGKDTAAAALVRDLGFTRIAFADAVRDMALAIDPLLYGDIRLSAVVRAGGWEQAKTVPEVRRLLQKIGTEGVRDIIGEDSWVRAAERKMAAVDGPVVFTDCRFPNEARAIIYGGGKMIRVVRLNEDDDSEFDNGLGVDHPSERHVPLLPVSLVIRARSVHELQTKIKLAAAETLCASS